MRHLFVVLVVTAAAAVAHASRKYMGAGPAITGRGNYACSFSLYGLGSDGRIPDMYMAGMLHNLVLLESVLPNWGVWVYTADNIPADQEAELREYGGDRLKLIKMPIAGIRSPLEPRMWRFLIADDPDLDVFMVMDADCRMWSRKLHPLDAFMRSNHSVLTLHDHPLHTTPMLAGLWGGRTRVVERRCGKTMKSMIDTWPDLLGWGGGGAAHDRDVLRYGVWPCVKDVAWSMASARVVLGRYCNGAAQCSPLPKAWDHVMSRQPHGFDWLGRKHHTDETHFCHPNPYYCYPVSGITPARARNLTLYLAGNLDLSFPWR